MQAARVLIADDHEITRIGVQSVLSGDRRYEICGQARDGRTALQKIEELKPDLVVLDLDLPHLNGVEVAWRALRQYPDLAVVIFTEIESEQSVRNALQFGVRGFVLKSDPVCDLLNAMRTVLQGKTFLAPRLAHIAIGSMKGRYKKHTLTRREREVLQLIAEAKGIKEIARLLAVSVKTVETHRNRVMKKLGAHSTPKLILQALRNEIIHVPNLTPASIPVNPASGTSMPDTHSPTVLSLMMDDVKLASEVGA